MAIFITQAKQELLDLGVKGERPIERHRIGARNHLDRLLIFVRVE
jgi:hypothetical protein